MKFHIDVKIIKIMYFLVSLGFVSKTDNWSSIDDNIAGVNQPLHELKKNKIICHFRFINLDISLITDKW